MLADDGIEHIPIKVVCVICVVVVVVVVVVERHRNGAG
jgi:hypothetical protein